MEGLIPLVYKTIKKTQSRRHYECLSSGAAQSYNVADFFTTSADYSKQHAVGNPLPDQKIAGFDSVRNGHRRHKSVHVDYLGGGGYSPEHTAKPNKQLVRFRSHRMFSCMTGA